MGRSSTTGRNTESMNDRWLPAKITPPVFGMFSLPTTHGRKTVNINGPTNRFFNSQYSIPSASQAFRLACQRWAGLVRSLGRVDPGEIGRTDDAGVVHELGCGEERLRMKAPGRQVRQERVADWV